MQSSSAVTGTTCVEVGGTGVGGQPSMRGVRGLTCTAASGTGAGIGVDINTQNFSLSDAHFEDYNLGVEVGDLSSARGVWLSNITGGNSLVTVVDINMNCATSSGTNCSAATADINLQSVYKSTSTTTFTDNISGKTATDTTLGFYSLGDGTGLGAASTRPVVTTSSSIGSSPNLVGMTAPNTPVTGVQGTTGTLVQMSTGSAFTGGNLLKSDSNSNTADSGIPATYIANPVTFFTNATGTALNTDLTNTVVKLWGFSLPSAITTTQITYDVQAADSVKSYSIGIYDSGGNQKVAVGPSTTLVNTTGSQTVSWTTGSGTTLVPGKYYFATATNCTTSCAHLYATPTASFAISANGGTATGGGGFPAGALTLPGDSWTVGAIPPFTIH